MLSKSVFWQQEGKLLNTDIGAKCCCDQQAEVEMKIEILGTGCPKCKKLVENVQAAADDLGLPYEIGKVTEIAEIIKYGVMSTPALVVDGQVKSAGKLLSAQEIKKLLRG